jgi:hypothetical protein
MSALLHNSYPFFNTLKYFKMKKIVFFPLLALFSFFTACKKENVPFNRPQPLPPVTDLTKSDGTIPTNHPINDFWMNRDSHTLAEFDAYYRDFFAKTAIHPQLKENMKHASISMMVKMYDLPEKASPETLAFYINEFITFKEPEPKILLTMLQKAEGVWGVSKSKDLAIQTYNRVVNNVQAKLLNPNDYVKELGLGFEALKIYGTQR